MAEEQKWPEPGGHRLCANNCGFLGSPTTLNLCSKCYKDHCMKEQQMKEAKLAMEKTLAPKAESSCSSSSKPLSSSDVKSDTPQPEPEEVVVVNSSTSPSTINVTDIVILNTVTTSQPNRCATCRRRVGLTGFKCRCGITFCGSHRYPEEHDCMFDYKAMGREAIAKANPIVMAEKLDKI